MSEDAAQLCVRDRLHWPGETLIAEICLEQGITIDRESEGFRTLARELTKKLSELKPVLSARDRGDYSNDPLREPLVSPEPSPAVVVAMQSVPVAVEGPKLSVCIDQFITDKAQSGKFNSKTQGEYRQSLLLFTDLFGDVPVTSVTRDMGREYREKLKRVPFGRAYVVKRLGKSVCELVETEHCERVVSVGTQVEYLNRLSELLNWCVREKDYIPKNPLEALPKAEKPKNPRKPFSREDLQRLFLSPAYTAATFDEQWQYWLPLLGLFTGARINELAQLRVQDVETEDGVPMLRITNDDDDETMKIKTAAARRSVPVHSTLLAIGFLEYVEMIRVSGRERLWNLTWHQKNGYGHKASCWFRDYNTRCGTYIRNVKVFHSFRNTAISKLLSCGETLVNAQKVVGHAGESVTEVNYNAAEYPPRVMQRIIERLDYGIDFSPLAGQWRNIGL